jgi:SagB-type dehydrogenase family enzyme
MTKPSTVTTMTRYSFKPDVHLRDDGADLLVVHGWNVTRIAAPSPGLRAAIAELATGPVSLEAAAAAVLGGGQGVTDLARLYRLLEHAGSALVRTLDGAGGPLVSIVPQTRTARLDLVQPRPDQPVRLCRFAYLHRRDGRLVVESPLSEFRVVLLAPAACRLVTALAETSTTEDLLAATADLPGEAVTALVTHLVAARIVLVAAGSAQTGTGSAQPEFADESDEALRQWSFHDLLFHSRSRLGRHDEPSGATFRFTGMIEPAPAVKPVPDGPRIPLHRPELSGILARDMPFTAVLESRRSVRQYGDQPLTVDQVGEFLYRAARVRAVYGPDPDNALPYVGADRPYPTGGAAGDLELYLTVNRCQGLDRAIYHYHAAGHELVVVNTDQRAVDTLLAIANVSAAQHGLPDVLITITSRFPRLGWKYSGIAYATTLKHVGVLYQTCYLVATAMGLAPCGLGNGDSDYSTYALGLDWVRESAVGEFMLGSRPPAPAASMGADRRHRGWQALNDPDWADRAVDLARHRRSAGSVAEPAAERDAGGHDGARRSGR